MTDPVTTEETAQSKIFANLIDPFQPQNLLPSLSAGLVTGIIAVIRGISYAALIFAGSLSGYLSTGIGMAIFSNAAMGIVVALLAPFPGIIATPLAAPTAVLAALASAIATRMNGSFPPQDILLTVIAAIIISTVLSGLLLLLLGRLKLGNQVQLIPHSVIGGFMGGTGLILLQGSLQVMTNVEFRLSQLSVYLQPEVLSNWMTGILCALVLLVVSNRYQHFLVIPGTLLALIGVFYLGFLLTNTSFAEAKAQDWLLSFAIDEGQLWQPLMPSQWDGIRWSVILQNWDAIASVIFICLLELVLTKNGIELFVRRDIDLNRTLEAVGLGNLIAGMGSGMSGNQALPSTILVSKMGASRRLTGIICALVSIAVLFLGPSFLSFFPRPVIGALSFYLGLSLVIQWVYRTWFQLDVSEYVIIILSLIVIFTVGFLEGIAVGFAAQLVLFLYNYAQREIIKDDWDGIETRTEMLSFSDSYILQEKNHPIQLWQLQGYIFFATANRLVEKFRQLLNREEQQKPSYLIIDGSRLEGLDASTVVSCAKILRLAAQQHITIVYTNLTPLVEHKLDRGHALERNNPYCQNFPDLEQGLQWCESQLLEKVSLEQSASLP
ncbi:MAG: STAS domain-containing protein [Cyanobacteria bacterium]|jgi:SulP family sulfate permease|nr:STAS domain-containing protein [Cyanobacteria bacterium GSL.Bin21]